MASMDKDAIDTKKQVPTDPSCDGGIGTVEELGYHEDYRRVFKSVANVSLVLAIASPLPGIMITASYPIVYGGYWGLTWGWLIPAVLFFPQALAVAELSSSMPINGAFYWWTAALAPQSISRPMSFIFGWFSMLAGFTSMASYAYATGSSYAVFISILRPEWSPKPSQIMGIAMGFVIFWAFMHLLGMERLSFVFMGSAFFVLVFFIIFVTALPVSYTQKGHHFTDAAIVFGQYTNYSDWRPSVAVPFSWFCAAWTITGWTAPAMIAEETVDASKKVPKSIVISYAASAGLGLVVSVIIAFCIRDIAASASDPTGFPIYSLLIELWGTKLACAFLMSNMGTIALGGSSLLFSTSSQIAAFARDGGLPASATFARVNKRTNIPLASCGLVTIGALAILLFGLSSEASGIIYSLAVVALYITYSVPITLRLVAGKRFVPGKFRLGKLSIPVHAAALVSMIYIMVMETFPASPNWTPDTFNFNWVVALGVFIGCILAWLFVGKKSYRGPNLAAIENWIRDAK